MTHTHDVTVAGDVVRKCFVSWDEGEPEREWAALELLARTAPGLAPTPISRERRDGRPIVVMSLVPGEPLGPKVSSAQQQALLVTLRRLFAVPVPHDLDERASGPSWMRDHVSHALAEDYDLTACREPDLIRTAQSRAVAWLRELPPPQIIDRVIALGDGNLNNVLWDGAACRLIDWEEFGVSDLAHEIAEVVEHASSRLTRSIDVDAIVNGFGLSEIQRARVDQHRLLLACFWLTMLLPGNRGYARNTTGSTEDQARNVLALLASTAG